MSRVTTITLPDWLHAKARKAGARSHRSMAGVIRDALAREMAEDASTGSVLMPRLRAPPVSVLDWLRAPPGSCSGLARHVGESATDWDPDGEESGLDAD